MSAETEGKSRQGFFNVIVRVICCCRGYETCVGSGRGGTAGG